eukprot:3936540-Rhodomonas_salina.1
MLLNYNEGSIWEHERVLEADTVRDLHEGAGAIPLALSVHYDPLSAFLGIGTPAADLIQAYNSAYLTIDGEPQNLKEVMSDPNKDKWLEARDREWQSLQAH